jgi:predicted PurR-regulated permease PerM
MDLGAFNWQKFTYFLLSFFLIFFLLIEARVILLPLGFAFFIGVLLIPLCHFFERYVKKRMVSVLLAFTALGIIVSGIVLLFSYQVYRVIRNIPHISDRLKGGIARIIDWCSEAFNLSRQESAEWMENQLSGLIDAPVSWLTAGLSSSSQFIVGFVLVIIYTFLILIYRTAFKNFLLIQARPENRDQMRDLIDNITRMTKRYLSGRLIVMLILAVLNSLGLWFIGVDYPILWGCLAAILTIIPFIGTTLGGTLPLLYSIAVSGSIWQPIGVVALYAGIQQLEGNFITPKVVGMNIKLNPLAAIFAMVVGGVIWGVAGLILALPIVAAGKIILEQFDVFKPVALLFDKDIYQDQDKFFTELDEEKYRLSDFLNKEKEEY